MRRNALGFVLQSKRRAVAILLVATLGLFAAACSNTVEGMEEDAEQNVDEVQEELQEELQED